MSERIARGSFHRFQNFSSTVSHLHPFFLENKQIRAIIKNRTQHLNFPCKIIQNYPKFLFHHPCPLLFSIIIEKLSSKRIFFRVSSRMKLLVDNVTLRGTETRISLRSRDSSIEIGNEKKREREENLSSRMQEMIAIGCHGGKKRRVAAGK